MHLETLAGRRRSRTAARVFTPTVWPIGSRPTAEAEICQTLPTIPRFHGPTRNRIPPGPPCGIDPATASHEGADANVPTGLEPGGAK